MKEITKSDILSVVKEFKRMIKLNKHILPLSDLEINLIELLKLLNTNKCNFYYAYTDVLAQFGKFIDNFNIDTTQISKSILNQFKKHHKPSNTSNSEDDSDGENNSDSEVNSDNNNKKKKRKESNNKQQRRSIKQYGKINEYASNQSNKQR